MDAQRDLINHPQLTLVNNAELAQDGKQADDEYTAYVKSRVPLHPGLELQLFIVTSKIRLAVDKGLLK